MNKTEHKKQHFVPRLLQRFFSIDSSNIGCYHIKSGNCTISPISNTAQKDNYYKANNDDRTSLELVYGRIEGDTMPILKRLQERDFVLSSNEIEVLFLFVVAQLMRTPKAAKAMGAVLQFCIDKGIEEVCKEVNSKARNMSNLPMQATISIPNVAAYLSGKGYIFVQNDTKTRFLLSDNPACLFIPVVEIAKEKGISDKMHMQEPFSGFMLYLPLGPSVGIICFDDDYYNMGEGICFNSTEEDVKTLNTLEVVNASKIVLYLDGTFNVDDIREALDLRKTKKAHEYEDLIYTPIEKAFSLSVLNIDEVDMVYKINMFENTKRRRPSILDQYK